MRKAIFLSLLMTARLAAGGQAAVPAVDPDDVILTEDERVVADCTSLGEVSGKSGSGWLLTGDRGAEKGADKVLAQLRARAAALGATAVLVQKASSLFVTKAAGLAYRCSAETLSWTRTVETYRRRRVERSMVFPERAFAVDTGFVGLQAGVMNRHVQRVPFRGLPTAFFLLVRNETGSPAFVAARLQLKETADEATEIIFPGKVKILTWDSFGVPTDRDIPLEIAVYADSTRKDLRATEKTALFFPSGNLKLLDNGMDPRTAPTVMIFGWKEQLSSVKPVPGSLADSELQEDILWTLYREESKSRRDCKRSVLAVEPRQVAAEDQAARFPEVQPAGTGPLAGRKGALEVWRVQSCDEVTAYDVLVLPTAEGPAEFLFKRAAV